MAVIEFQHVAGGPDVAADKPACAWPPVPAMWAAVAAQIQAWLQQHGLSARDAVLLLPFAALLPPAREALATLGGWQPRVETPLTLAASLGPPQLPQPGTCTGARPLDRLVAAGLLRQQDWARAWQARDPAGHARIVDALVDAAQALRATALLQAPAARPGFWERLRVEIAATSAGPAATEALLLRVALEWAAVHAVDDTDRLYTCTPSAWITLRLGGADTLAEAVLAASGAPALVLDADPPVGEPCAAAAGAAGPTQLLRLRCDNFEDEAQAAAAAVIEALSAGRTPVALVVLDRLLVRRIRALLQRQGVAVVDETGWKLSTTAAASRLMRLLRAAAPGASADLALDWLKTWPAAEPAALLALEARWRGTRRLSAGDVAAAERLWARAQAHLLPLAAAGRRHLADWLLLLASSLAADGSDAALAADGAGPAVLAALRLAPGTADDPAWREAAQGTWLDLGGFAAWVEATLEQLPWLPLPDPGAQVVLTPLARAIGRPFGQVVLPGADHSHLGAIEPPAALIGDVLAARLGLDHAAARRSRQRLALAQLLRAPALTLLRRHRDGVEPLADSPEVEWLLLARTRSGAAPWPLQAWQPATAAHALVPLARPLPRAPLALPATLSASQVEALRQCPYRFYARAVLRLDEADELDLALAKRDYGTWLHAVLDAFHRGRAQLATSAAEDTLRLQAAADATTAALGLDAAELLPFRASFEAFAPAYLAWLAAREAAGWRWHSGEADHSIAPAELGGMRLRGRLDRLDSGPGGAQQLLDYKTGAAQGLRDKVNGNPAEDTQLAFYAALIGAAGRADEGAGAAGRVLAAAAEASAAAPLRAAYLALDDAGAPLEIEHPEVALSAELLLQGLGQELQRLRLGAPLPALGEGRVCATCEARGLCRRDSWAPA